jgi:hypothetical protein
MTEYNLSHHKWTVSSEAGVLNRNVNKYILSPHQQIVQLFCEHT